MTKKGKSVNKANIARHRQTSYSVVAKFVCSNERKLVTTYYDVCRSLSMFTYLSLALKLTCTTKVLCSETP